MRRLFGVGLASGLLRAAALSGTLGILTLVLVLVLVPAICSAEEPRCAESVSVYEAARDAGRLCPEDAAGRGLTLLDLSDEYLPRVLRRELDDGPDDRDAILRLASERWSELPAQAVEDRGFELWGVAPTFGVLLARLDDEARHHCHDVVDDSTLAAAVLPLARDDRTPLRTRRADPKRVEAIRGLEAHLACEGLLEPGSVDGAFDATTARALDAYRRLHMVPATGPLDEELRDLLLTDSRELDFRSLLRALRERVTDATGLLEDGSARGAWELVLGRRIEALALRDTAGHAPLTNGASDLISPATEAAARALGFTDPAAARAALAALRVQRARQVAVRLPGTPTYHGPAMDLRVEIDRGDVWTGRGRSPPRERRPALTIYARTLEGGEVALARYPTTIGGWQREQLPGGDVVMRYKGSPAGDYVWSDIVALPAWFPPPTTPDRELVRRTPRGWQAREDTVGPGYRSAYGLVMIRHRRPTGGDPGTRTHGTVSYLSVARGEGSHGCHRLSTHLALRVSSFLLAHRAHRVSGEIKETYRRTVRWAGRSFLIRREARGYTRVLDPPVPVRVLRGRVQGRVRRASPAGELSP